MSAIYESRLRRASRDGDAAAGLRAPRGGPRRNGRGDRMSRLQSADFGAADSPAEARVVAFGVSHHTAPLELRECFAFDADAVADHLRDLCSGMCDEALILSTCNRFELYAVVADAAIPGLRDWWRRIAGAAGQSCLGQVHEFDHREAVGHLFRVASSLDSLVLGEPQILGQVKDAVRIAGEAGALGPTLDLLSRRAFEVAKRVRTETAIGRSRVGVGNAGVDLARRLAGRLDGRSALLVGVGAMGRQVARALLAAGATHLVVANRTFEHAQALAAECGPGAEAIPFAELDVALRAADIVITATSAATPLIGADAVQRALARRADRPLLCIDLAVPRNIDPAVAGLANVRLCNVDDLAAAVERGRTERWESCNDALRIIDQERSDYFKDLRERAAGPAIGHLTRVAETLRKNELARCRRQVGLFTPEQGEMLEAMSRALTNKLLDGPLRAIREAARAGDDDRLQCLLAQWDGLERGLR